MSGVRANVVALVLGLAFAALTLSAGFVSGRGPFWSAPPGDAAQSEIGWMYYARDDWRFPIFAVGNTHAPEGSNVLLSDSLPLLALPAKIVYRATMAKTADPPIYTGLWVALCLVLQALVASRLLSALDIRDPVMRIAGIALLCYAPILLLRFGQMTLLAHFAILLALEGYVRAKRGTLGPRHAAFLCALPVLLLLVHPYLAAMCGILVAATILDQWRERRLSPTAALARFVAIALGAAVVVIVGGFAVATSSYEDYGRYSMNLLSPFVPFAATSAGRMLGTSTPTIAGLDQWEGGAYLGIGAFVVCLAALPALRNVRSGLRRHAVLIVALSATLVFAISNRIGFGAHELLHVPLPDAAIGLLSTFRGSGRFVWIVVYALLALVIAVVARRWSKPVARAILIAAAILQIVDVAPMQHGVRVASANAAPASIDREAWRDLVAKHERIFEFPSFECGGAFDDGTPGSRWRELDVDWIAARANVPTNSAYLARPYKDCSRERDEAARDIDRAGTLYLYRSSDDVGALLAASGANLARCRLLDEVVVCPAAAR